MAEDFLINSANKNDFNKFFSKSFTIFTDETKFTWSLIAIVYHP